MQDCSKSIANELELLQPRTKTSIIGPTKPFYQQRWANAVLSVGM